MTGLPAVLSRSWSAMCFAELGEFNKAIAFGEEAVRLADAVDHPFSLIRACLQLGSLYQRKGEFVKAIPPLERGSQVCGTRQDSVFISLDRLSLATYTPWSVVSPTACPFSKRLWSRIKRG